MWFMNVLVYLRQMVFDCFISPRLLQLGTHTVFLYESGKVHFMSRSCSASLLTDNNINYYISI